MPSIQAATGDEMTKTILQHGMNCAGLILGQEDECTCGLRWRIELATEQEMHAAWRKRAEEAELREGSLQIRIDNAIAELDSLADLLADSEELLVDQTPAVRLINEIIEALAGLPRNKE